MQESFSFSFEEALKELEQLVQRLQSGQQPLADAIRDYQRGLALKRHCEKQLADAKMQIEKVTALTQEGLLTEPLEVETSAQ
jgi:exodeoxyribonuclease VII small subunit